MFFSAEDVDFLVVVVDFFLLDEAAPRLGVVVDCFGSLFSLFSFSLVFVLVLVFSSSSDEPPDTNTAKSS